MHQTPMKKAGSLKRAKPLALPESVAWMERLAMDMTTCANQKLSLIKRNNTLFQLQLTYTAALSAGKDVGAPSTSSWTVSRTFDEYRSLQRRLVKALRPGHKCNAECKWLVGVIKNHFPKASLFCKNCPSTVESRRLSLLRLMTTVRASLVNHGNLGCANFRDQVSKEFANFLLGDCDDAAVQQLKHVASASSATTDSSSSASDTTESASTASHEETNEDELTSSMVSFTSDEENLVLDFEFDDDFSDFECGLCGLSLDALEEATCTSPYCTTATFDCGHQFHDLCVLPMLDEEVKCPLCQ